LSMKHEVVYAKNTVTVKNVKHFKPETILFCGQAFRWRKTGEGEFRGVAHGRVLNLAAKDGDIRLYPATQGEYETIWERYFDFKRDYGALMGSFTADPLLKKSMEYADGMRVLNQEPFETLVSFILSANNNIRRNTGIIESLCCCFGEKLEYNGEVYSAFPEPEALANAPVSAIAACGAGYRAPYVQKAAQSVAGGFGLEALRRLDYETAKKALMEIKGVGGKVADCVLLYSLGFSGAFPMDVWMKHVVCDLYGFCGQGEKELRRFIGEKFGEDAGIAQQYLFHYARMNKTARKKALLADEQVVELNPIITIDK